MISRTTVMAALERYFGYTSFKPLQEDVIRATLQGKDVLAVMPTGGGKSLCYQLPALVNSGLTVVVSPLVSLMKDQVDALDRAGVPATMLDASLDFEAWRQRMDGIRAGEYRLLYVSPERLNADSLLSTLAGEHIRAIVVDEAHCVSQWGHDFRPEYRLIAKLREVCPGASFAAFTASATAAVREDVARTLALRDPAVFVGSFDRPNLFYAVTPKGSREQTMFRLVESVKQAIGQAMDGGTDGGGGTSSIGTSGIVYALSRRSVDEIAAALRTAGVKALAYHAGYSPPLRAETQERWLSGETQVIVATIAFGMGINKPDVRFVIHADLPKDLESYYQETGRAGRDGAPSACLLFYSDRDVSFHAKHLAEKSTNERARAEARLQTMMAFAAGNECRRRALLVYFGEEYRGVAGSGADETCGGCDNCVRRGL